MLRNIGLNAGGSQDGATDRTLANEDGRRRHVGSLLRQADLEPETILQGNCSE